MDHEEWRGKCIKASDKCMRAVQAWNDALPAPPGTIDDEKIERLRNEAVEALREVEKLLANPPT